jgi:hypothetical protein
MCADVAAFGRADLPIAFSLDQVAGGVPSILEIHHHADELGNRLCAHLLHHVGPMDFNESSCSRRGPQ